MYQYQMTLIVMEYNADFNRMSRSIMSALLQRDIKLQIIVTDDSSSENHFEWIEKTFKQWNFEDYSLIKSEKNVGPGYMVEKALQKAQGKYFFGLGAGDYLYDETVLCDIYKYMEDNSLDVCMGRVVCYNEASGEFSVLAVPNCPRNMQINYSENSILKRMNYLELDDNAFGTSLVARTDLRRRYEEMTLKEGINYLNDMAFRIMMFDNCSFKFFERVLMFYEYGNGISTCGDTKWKKIGRDEWRRTDDIMLSMDPKDWVARRYQRLLQRKKKVGYERRALTLWLYPEMYFLRRQARKTRENTVVDVDLHFYNQILQELSDIRMREELSG